MAMTQMWVYPPLNPRSIWNQRYWEPPFTSLRIRTVESHSSRRAKVPTLQLTMVHSSERWSALFLAYLIGVCVRVPLPGDLSVVHVSVTPRSAHTVHRRNCLVLWARRIWLRCKSENSL